MGRRALIAFVLMGGLILAVTSSVTLAAAAHRSCQRKGERIARESAVAVLLAPPGGSGAAGTYYACWRATGRLTRMDTETYFSKENFPDVFLKTVVGRWAGLVRRATDHPGLWVRDTIVMADAQSHRTYKPPLPTRPPTVQGSPLGLIVIGFAIDRCGNAAYVYRPQTGASFSATAHLLVWHPHHRAVEVFAGHYDRGSLRVGARLVRWQSNGHQERHRFTGTACRPG